MTWHDAHDLINTRSCAVKGCTGIAYKRDNDLCEWHDRNGTPDQYTSRKTPVLNTEENLAQTQARLDELDTQIARLHDERRRVYRRLTRLQDQLR